MYWTIKIAHNSLKFEIELSGNWWNHVRVGPYRVDEKTLWSNIHSLT